jgi:hypothetical protein
MFIEITTFKIITTEAELLTASEKIQIGYLSKCDGYLSRTLSKSDVAEYIDILHWSDEESAKKAAENAMTDPIAGEYLSNMDMNSIQMKHIMVLQQY